MYTNFVRTGYLFLSEGGAAWKLRGGAQFFLYPYELVVFGDTVGARGGAGLDLACSHGDDEVGDECVFGFAGAVRDDGGVAVFARHFDGFDGFGDGANLIELN